MKKITGLMIMISLGLTIFAQAPADKNIIDKLCGCFDVEFKYAETFSPDKNYKYHDREEISGGTELTLPVEISDRKIVMQHLLVITDSIIIKHWREEWTFENPVIWKYQGDKVWTKQVLKPEEVKGKWTQTVWEVSDEPRYQGYSQWVNLDGRMIWQSTADAPLPRREYSVRDDYNILRRTNRLNITDSGYIHEQDNRKVVRKNGTDKLIAEEKGINSYKRLSDKECAAAKYYWEKNKVFWTKVRKTWDDYISTQTTIALKSQVNGKPLHSYLFSLESDYANKKISEQEIDQRIKAELTKFIGHDDKTVAQQ